MGESSNNAEIRKVLKQSSDRLYNPKLRTESSGNIWRKATDLFTQNAEELQLILGSTDFVVSLHGSALLGVATKPSDEKEWGSDVDVIIYVGEHNAKESEVYEQMRQKIESKKGEYVRAGIERSLLGEFRDKKAEPMFGRMYDPIIVRVSDLVSNSKHACNRILEGRLFEVGVDRSERVDNRKTLLGVYETMILLVTNPIYQTNEELSSNFKDKIINLVLSTPGGDRLWNVMRTYFNNYVVNYEDYMLDAPPMNNKHQYRVAEAFEDIFRQRNVSPEHSERAKNFLRKQRADIKLPSFTELRSLQRLPING